MTAVAFERPRLVPGADEPAVAGLDLIIARV